MQTIKEQPTKIIPPPLRPVTTVRSNWRPKRLAVDGVLNFGEWAEAGSLAIPKGYLLVQNDDEWLYLALDLVEDDGNDPQNDYFWLYIDVDQNGKPTAYHDLLFSIPHGNPNTLGRWLVSGPNSVFVATPATYNIASRVRQGFGKTLQSDFAHRVWELAIKLDEIGVTLQSSGPPQTIRFGLHIGSGSPPFTADTPAHASSDFANFRTIVLARPEASYAAGTAGAVIGGVGFVPATKIGSNGLGTVNYAGLAINNAAFGGVLNFMENAETIHDLYTKQGARTFAIQHRSGKDDAALTAAMFTPLLTHWSNYHWSGSKYVLEAFGPDADARYPLVDPSVDYSIKSLLFAWDTAGQPNQLHQFKLDFFTQNGTAVNATPQVLTLRIDNRAPSVELLEIRHGRQVVNACDIIELTAPAELAIDFRAYDDEGLLDRYDVFARFGNNETLQIASDEYAAHQIAPFWNGEVGKTATFRTDRTCAYDFTVSAHGRVTNGYAKLQQVETHRSVTVKVPGAAIMKPVPLPRHLPHGFGLDGKMIK